MQQIPQELLELIHGGENLTVEFKKSRTEITKDVYETVCAFSNRDGGHIFLGVRDTGEIIGIEDDSVDKVKKEFVTSINNENKMYPPLYLTPVEYESDGNVSFMSVCRFRTMSADATAAFMTETMSPTLTLLIIRTKYIDYMQGKAEVIL